MKHIKPILIIVLSVTMSTAFAVDTFPHYEGFESGFGDWIQSGADNIDWSLNSGPTGSSGTGPLGAHEQNWYAYTESSGYGTGHPNMTAIISAEFDFSSLSSPAISFYYYMYGSTIGDLYVEVDDGDGYWDVVSVRSEQKQTNQNAPWYMAFVDLSAYQHMSNVKIRFRGVTGGNYTSDICIDDIWVYDQPEATLDHFVWSPIDPLQEQGVPIPVEVKAANAQGQTLTSFNKAVAFSAWSGGFEDACENRDFSLGLSGWTTLDVGFSPGPYTTTYSRWGSGDAFRMKPNTGPDGIAQEINLKGGETYQISAKCVMVNAGSSATPNPVYSSIHINDVEIDTTFWSIPANYQYSRYLYGHFTPPTDGTYTLKLISETADTEKTTLATFFDDISVSFAPPQFITTSPSLSGQFTNGVWSGTVTVGSRLPDTRFIARYRDIQGVSNPVSTYISLLDLDRDGLLDSWENLYFDSPEDCIPQADFDGDGYCNEDEYFIGTIPNLKSSSLALTATNTVNGKFILKWQSVTNRTYDVQWTPNLIITPFTDLDTDIGFPRASFTNDIPVDGNMGFYRIKVHKN